MGKLRDSARGQPCMIRLPGICSGGTETTVLAHINGGGMALKKPDLLGAFACDKCHGVVDGKIPTDMPEHIIELHHWQAVGRTIEWWVENGYIELGAM